VDALGKRISSPCQCRWRRSSLYIDFRSITPGGTIHDEVSHYDEETRRHAEKVNRPSQEGDGGKREEGVSAPGIAPAGNRT